MNKKILLQLVLLCMLAQTVVGAELAVESQLSFRRFTTVDGLSQMQTETVWQDSRGYIYIGTLSGFARYDGLTLTPFLKGRRENIVGFQEIGGQVRAMGFLRQWVVGSDKASMIPLDTEGKLLLNNFNAADLPPGYVLMEDRREQNRMLCFIDAGGRKIVAASSLLDDMTPDRKLYVDSSDIYVPTPHGLFVLTKGNAVQQRRLSAKNDVFSLIRNGDRLYALAADGIYIVGNDDLKLLYEHHFEAPDYGLMVRLNRQGHLIIADSHTIWCYDGNMRQMATGFNMIKGIFIDKWNRLWAATYQGAYCFFHCNFINHRLTDQNDIVRAIAVLNNKIVMGTLNGKVIADGKLLNSKEGGFFAPSATVLGERVYMVGNGGMAAVHDGHVEWTSLNDDVYQFVARYTDRLVIGTRQGNVLEYNPRNGETDTLTTEIVRPWCAADDGRGRLWVSGNPGLYCLTGIESGKIIMQKVKSTPTTLVITAMAADSCGRVCFAIGDSLFAIRDGKVRTMTEALSTLSGHEIRSLHISPKGYLVVAAIDGLMVARIGNDCQATDIHWFDAHNGFTMIEPLAATMAESADGTVWLAGLEETVSFNPEDLLTDNQYSTIVEAPRPWWLQWWWWLIAATLLSLVVWRVTRWVGLRQARRKMIRLEREKMQKELQLGAARLKSIPHFHANVLASIEYFMMNHSTDEASHYLKLYSDFTNQTLSDIDRPSRSVTEEVDYVRTYLELERLRYGNRLNYSITVDDETTYSMMLPTMLLHTYCQNAVKHGIANKEGGGNVEVVITRQQRDGADGVLVEVSDDGVGRTEAAHSGTPSTKQGLKILRQQIELYNSINRYHIAQHVADLTDAKGRPVGTRFETWVPADFNY
ncbi:MAG: histidine kinase [Prevotella sp.]|nr:histidine kinase [Prevotella sp.]